MNEGSPSVRPTAPSDETRGRSGPSFEHLEDSTLEMEAQYIYERASELGLVDDEGSIKWLAVRPQGQKAWALVLEWSEVAELMQDGDEDDVWEVWRERHRADAVAVMGEFDGW